MKMRKIKDGELMQPSMKGFRMACCDCGLTHTIDFKVYKQLANGKAKYMGKEYKVHFKAYRNNRSTALLRRGYKGITFKNSKKS